MTWSFGTASLGSLLLGAGIACTSGQPSSPPGQPGGFSSSEAEPVIRWVSASNDPRRVTVQVSGLGVESLKRLSEGQADFAHWSRVLAVYVNGGKSILLPDVTSMLGDYEVKEGVLCFRPRFPLEPGLSYEAVLNPAVLTAPAATGMKRIVSSFQAPARSMTPTTAVQQVFPSTDRLPENLLKFYVHFSAPMSRGRIYQHIHLFKADGSEVELPFLELDEELWDPTLTRLTLFIDPGRIKRGVKPLEEIGPSLEQGGHYTLVIDHAWKDGHGVPLKENFHKSFQVGPADRKPPDPANWSLHAPKADTREPLVIDFPEPMESALARRMIVAVDAAGKRLAGEVALADEERSWSFIPATSWRPGPHQIIVQTAIEDLAGNNIGKPFEVDLFEGVQRQLTNAAVSLIFTVK